MRHWLKYRSLGAFDPSQESSLYLWIDADDSGNYTTSGSTITGITDKSSSGHSISITGDPQLETGTLNSKDSFRFDNSDYLVIGAAADWRLMHYEKYTIYAVLESHPGNSNPGNLYSFLATGYGASGARDSRLLFDDRGGGSLNDGIIMVSDQGSSNSLVISEADVFTFDAPHLLYMWADNQNPTAANRGGFEVDEVANTATNSQTASASSTNPGYGLHLNTYANGNWKGDLRLHELIICDDLLTVSRQADFETYLQTKWNL